MGVKYLQNKISWWSDYFGFHTQNGLKMPQKWKKKHILVRYSLSDRSEILANKISWWSEDFGFHTQNGPEMVQNGLKMTKNAPEMKKGYFSNILLVW